MALQVWLPLNGNLNNQGLSNLVFSNVNTSNTTIDNNGKIGKCYANNSNTDGGLVSDKTINLTNHQSMFCWFKFTSLMSDSRLGGSLVSQHRYPSNRGMGLTIKYVSSTTGYLSINTGTGSARTYNTYCCTTLMQANTWYHGGYTYDGATIKIYLNGICEKTVNFTGMSVPADYISIFNWSFASSGSTLHPNYKLKGSINDVRVYDHCLSKKEVKEIAQGLVLHYKLDCDNRLDIQPNRNPNLLTPTILKSSTPWVQSTSGIEIYKGKVATKIVNNTLYQKTSSGTTAVFPTLTFKPNTQYTLSITWCDHLRTDSYSSGLYFRFRYDDGTSSGNLISPTANNDADWTHAKLTSAAGKTISWISTTYAHGGGHISIAYIKLEEGTEDTGVALTCDHLYNANENILPVGSQRLKYLEYLQSDGAAYINTGIPYDSTKSTYRIECKFSQPSHVSSYDAIFGAYTAEANKCLRIIRFNNNSKMAFYYNNKAGSGNPIQLTTTNTNIREVIINSTTLSIKESGITNIYNFNSVTGTNTTSTFYLFSQGAGSCLSHSRIYYFRFYDNDVLVKNFIPVEYNGEYGMWETVSQTFYGNNNSSGTFVAGPQIGGLVYDCSGYGNNGNIIGNITFNNNTPRYNYCGEFNGASYIYNENSNSNIKTMCAWVKTTKNKSTSQMICSDNSSKLCISFYQGNIISYYASSGASTGSKCTLGSSYKENDWNFIVVISTGEGTRDVYCNNVKLTPTSNDYWTTQSQGTYIGIRNVSGTLSLPFYGYISDIRFYTTALSESAISKLYNNPAHIDNKNNLYGFEFDEWNISNPKILKNGIVKIDEFEEDNELENVKFISKLIKPNQLIEK